MSTARRIEDMAAAGVPIGAIVLAVRENEERDAVASGRCAEEICAVAQQEVDRALRRQVRESHPHWSGWLDRRRLCWRYQLMVTTGLIRSAGLSFISINAVSACSNPS